MTLTELAAVAVAIIGAAVSIYNAWSNRDATASEAWSKLLAPLRERIAELELNIVGCNKIISELRTEVTASNTTVSTLKMMQQLHEDGIRRLAAQVISLGGKPVYALPEEAKP